jgi:hypothetical protein
VSKIYGEELMMTKIEIEKNLKTGLIVEKERSVHFPKYLVIMNRIGDRVSSERISKKQNASIETIINTPKLLPMDSLDTLYIHVNTRTG